jgi:hypothetical protein
VLLTLSPADYLLALDAHGKGRQVSARGVLEKLGRGWRLVNPDNFSML